ncbi:MAG: sodium-dependent bicarbonate transport family permease, partial [Actinobacteria bacterium]|nr:sodium-dependent bicarbonate transport family permease [Actinomycetota bacterium]
IVLLIGGIVIGLIANGDSAAVVEPLFVALFPGVLVLFLLDLGVLAGERLDRIRAAGWHLVAFAIALPITFGVLGALAGTWVGLSVGGVTVLATMAASASYIAVRVGLPEADQGLALGAALGVTFPFNLVLGIPLYAELASRLA